MSKNSRCFFQVVRNCQGPFPMGCHPFSVQLRSSRPNLSYQDSPKKLPSQIPAFQSFQARLCQRSQNHRLHQDLGIRFQGQESGELIDLSVKLRGTPSNASGSHQHELRVKNPPWKSRCFCPTFLADKIPFSLLVNIYITNWKINENHHLQWENSFNSKLLVITRV
jgi:hypothetical protein